MTALPAPGSSGATRTLLRLCYFESYRCSAGLDCSAIDGLSRPEALAIVARAVTACRQRLELPAPDISADDGTTARVTYVGPLASHPRRLKLDISATELVETHRRVAPHARRPDMPVAALSHHTCLAAPLENPFNNVYEIEPFRLFLAQR